MAKPIRVRLSRAAGWRMPENTVKVDRSTKWGNPFVVGDFGTALECASAYELLVQGMIHVTTAPDIQHQSLARAYVAEHIEDIRGKNLACWCALDKPCHAEVLLKLANKRKRI